MQRVWRLDPVLVITSFLALGALCCVARFTTLGVSALALLLWQRQLRLGPTCLAALALAVGWARASQVLSHFEAERQRVQAWLTEPARCAVRGRVQGSPVVRSGSVQFDARLEELDCEGRQEHGPVFARLWGAPPGLARGDAFAAIVTLTPVSAFRNFSLPDPLPALARQQAVLRGGVLWLEPGERAEGVRAGIDRLREHVRARILATFAPSVQAMARALVLGESDLAAEDAEAFRKSGLSHLLAVSGTHLIFAVLSVLRALEAVLRRWEWLAVRWDVRRYAAACGLLLAPLYADFSGGSGSAWRAAFMLVAALGVRALGHHAFASRVLAMSLGLGWAADALVVFDPSFLLSLAATSGLLAFGEAARERGLPWGPELWRPSAPSALRVLRRLSDAALATLAATLPCVPILLLLSPGVSLAGVAANLLAAPLGEIVALPLCLAHALLAPLPALERGVALVASASLSMIREVARVTAAVESLFVELPPPGRFHVAVLGLTLAGLLGMKGEGWLDGSRGRHAGGRLRGAATPPPAVPRIFHAAAALLPRAAMPLWLGAGAVAFATVEAMARSQYSAAGQRARGTLRVTALDVGQGDSSLVDLPDGRLLLLDAGGLVGSSVDPGARVILPILRARRRTHVDILVLSHVHPDHFGGLSAVARNLSIGEFWYGGRQELDPAHPLHGLIAELQRRGVPVRTASELCRRAPWTSGYRIEVLWPCPGPHPAQSENDNSLVLRIALGERAALFMGDAEGWAEQQLVQDSAAPLRADFLKVGHHGSRSSTSPVFIARVQPRLASISAGLGNRFGHPHDETLTTLWQAGALVLRLDHGGSVEWQTDGERQGFRVFAGPDSEREETWQ